MKNSFSVDSRLRSLGNGRPKILFLADCWPLGRSFGGQLRALHTARALQEIGSVALAVVSSDLADEETIKKCAEEFEVQSPIFPHLSPKRDLVEKLQFLIDPRYLNVHGCVASAADRVQVLSYFSQYDLVWVLNARTPNILQIREWPHSHLDMSDVPSTYLQTVARRGVDRKGRWKARVQHVFFKRRELLFNQRFTTLSVCSEADRQYLGGGNRIHVIPNGFERPQSVPPTCPTQSPPRIGFIGLYSYLPNLEGMKWFVRSCWPLDKTTGS